MSLLSMMAADYLNKVDKWNGYELNCDRLMAADDVTVQYKSGKLAFNLILLGLGLRQMGKNLCTLETSNE